MKKPAERYKVIVPEGIQALNTWVPRVLYDRLKKRARLERRTIRALVTEAIQLLLSRRDKT